ncbi:thiosulfate sulfurtransferase/rhodanese-like domain-containing protein 3 [Neocloeon triangulifer]|uniref:thiosulfate sulfurtransferase/rhodanese-like domain-containing protein 3 n=1 Tax=Neocloeon triangulifer TaxID=2078957 RepID=UPI00286F97F0|nr:thiosulfate sulfurtransferase/rhodanese-like domain-containing protein 3 [Neocloeon triangulifer]
MSGERKVDLTYEDIVALKDEIVLVDVRDHNEIEETGQLPGSIHIPLPELKEALLLPPEEFKKKYDGAAPLKNAPLVFSCRSGNRSRRAMNAALELGFAESRHYIGGFLDWQAKTQK